MEQQPSNEPLFELQVDYDSGNRFKDAANWGRFIAIIIFICIGFFLLGLSFGASKIIELMSVSRPGIQNVAGLFIGTLFVLAAVYVYIVIQLYRFTILVKEGIERQDQTTFNNGLKALRNYFLVSGIVSLLMIVWTFYDTITNLF